MLNLLTTLTVGRRVDVKLIFGGSLSALITGIIRQKNSSIFDLDAAVIRTKSIEKSKRQLAMIWLSGKDFLHGFPLVSIDSTGFTKISFGFPTDF